MNDTDPNTIDDINVLRTMVEELQAYTRMLDVSYQSDVEAEVELRCKALEKVAHGAGHDEGWDAGVESANKDFSKHIEKVRGEIDVALDLHLSDYTA